jgi:hypothetical protein
MTPPLRGSKIRQMDDPAARTPCPTCGRMLGPPTKTWAGEPIPPGVIHMENVVPLHIAKIAVVCANGHRWKAQKHVWDLRDGHWYEGLMADES